MFHFKQARLFNHFLHCCKIKKQLDEHFSNLACSSPSYNPIIRGGNDNAAPQQRIVEMMEHNEEYARACAFIDLFLDRFSSLTSQQKTVFYSFHFDKISKEQIAKSMGCTKIEVVQLLQSIEKHLSM